MYLCPMTLLEPNHLRTSKCYLTITKRDNNPKLEIVIDMIQIQIITILYLINLPFAKIKSLYHLYIPLIYLL